MTPLTFLGLGQPVVDYRLSVGDEYICNFPDGHAFVKADELKALRERYNLEEAVAAGSYGNLRSGAVCIGYHGCS